MRKKTIIIASGVLLTAGAIAALAAPPRQQPTGMWGEAGADMMGDAAPGGRGFMRRWFGPKSITSDQYDTQTRERFARLDKNGDNVIDTSEIEAAFASREQQGMLGFRRRGNADGSGMGQRILQRFGDKDGKVTKEAFLAEAKRRFTQLDLNNDGKITDDDLPPLMRGKNLLKADGPAMPGRMGGRLMVLRQADTKKDGEITLDAFIAAQVKRFETWDRNKDGVIDKADFDLMRKEMTDYRVKRFLHSYGADADGKITRDQFYKVAKERFARLDRRGEGKISFGGRDGGMPGMESDGAGHGRRGRPGAEGGAPPELPAKK